jgi:hypothetical protein
MYSTVWWTVKKSIIYKKKAFLFELKPHIILSTARTLCFGKHLFFRDCLFHSFNWSWIFSQKADIPFSEKRGIRVNISYGAGAARSRIISIAKAGANSKCINFWFMHYVSHG